MDKEEKQRQKEARREEREKQALARQEVREKHRLALEQRLAEEKEKKEAEIRDQIQKEIDTKLKNHQDELEYLNIRKQTYLDKSEKEILVEMLLTIKDYNEVIGSRISNLEKLQKTLIEEVDSIKELLELM